MTLHKFIRGRLPEWYRWRLLAAIGCLNADHYRGRLPYTLRLTGGGAEWKGDGWLITITLAAVDFIDTQLYCRTVDELADGRVVMKTRRFEKFGAYDFARLGPFTEAA